MSANQLPSAFVWTKIEAEAGQRIDRIINRKELERQAGGAFWWGIGESKKDKIRLLLARDPRPIVVFSKMRSNAHSRDSRPNGVLLWQAYETADGEMPLPLHAVVISRAHDSKGNLKLRHYALVCENPMGIPCSSGGTLNAGSLRNFGDSGRPVGSSQITVVVERRTCNGPDMSYPITARATLVAPYAVQLSAPRQLSAQELRLLDEVSFDGTTSDDWAAVAKRLRRR